jgi:hypothetical protein
VDFYRNRFSYPQLHSLIRCWVSWEIYTQPICLSWWNSYKNRNRIIRQSMIIFRANVPFCRCSIHHSSTRRTYFGIFLCHAVCHLSTDLSIVVRPTNTPRHSLISCHLHTHPRNDVDLAKGTRPSRSFCYSSNRLSRFCHRSMHTFLDLL